MTNVKITVIGKNGNEYEALVPITKACVALFNEVTNLTNDTPITKMGYSVARQCHNFLYGKVKRASERAQLNAEIKPLFDAMGCADEILCTNGVILFKD